MTYDASKDVHPFGNDPIVRSDPAYRMEALTASGSPAVDLDEYPKALRIYVPSGASSPQIQVILAKDTSAVTIKFTAGGVFIEPICVRQIVAISSGVEVHGYFS